MRHQLASRVLDFAGFWPLDESMKICFACGGLKGVRSQCLVAVCCLLTGARVVRLIFGRCCCCSALRGSQTVGRQPRVVVRGSPASSLVSRSCGRSTTLRAWQSGAWRLGSRRPRGCRKRRCGGVGVGPSSALTVDDDGSVRVCAHFLGKSASWALKSRKFFWPRGADGHRSRAK